MPVKEKTPPLDPSKMPKPMGDWLDKLTGLKAESDKVQARIDSHETGQEMIADLDLEDLKKKMDFSLTKIPDGAWEKFKDKIGALDTLKSIDPDSDPMKEIDTWHDIPGTQGLPPEKVSEIIEAFKKIVELRDKLEKNAAYQKPDPKDPTKTVPDDDKIAADLWQPLVRQGVLPENAVPSKYSEVEKTFAGASKAYEARLIEYSDGLSDPQKLLKSMGPIFSVAEGLLKIGSASAGLSANIAAIEQGADSAQKIEEGRKALAVGKTLELTLLCVTSTRVVGEKLINDNDIHGAVDAFNAMLKGILTATVGKDAANLVATLITCTSRGVQTIDLLAKGDVAGALDAIADGVAAGIVQNNSDNKALSQYVKGGIKLMAAAVKAKDDPHQGLAQAIGAAGEAAKGVGGQYLADVKKAKEEEIEADATINQTEKDARVKVMKAHFSTNPSGVDDIVKGMKTAATLDLGKMITDSISKEQLEKDLKAFEEKQQKAMIEFLNEPDPIFEELLLNGFSENDVDDIDDDDDSPEAEERRLAKEVDDLEKQANKIETLIAICKKDQMTFDLAKQIINGGAGLVAQMLPAAGIIAVGTQLMFSIMEAIKHAEQLEIWTQNLGDAQKSGSVQADAMMSRFGLQKGQSIKADIIVALKAIDLIGQVVKTAGGPAAPVGLAIAAGAKIVEGVMDVALTIETEIRMAQAWTVYKKALKTPQDRKLARMALRQNPTLSKYAIAYGACEDKNPVAIKAMKRCGLNEKTLANSGTNVDKVVTYLETIYRDDPILLKAVVDPKEWHAGDPELGVLSWQTFFLNATTSKKIKPKVKAVDVSKITSAMSNYEKARKPFEEKFAAGYEAKASDDPGPLESVIVQAQILAVSLNRYSPVDAKKEEPHAGMAAYVDALEALALSVEGDVIDLRKDIVVAVQADIDKKAQSKAEAEMKAARDKSEFDAGDLPLVLPDFDD